MLGWVALRACLVWSGVVGLGGLVRLRLKFRWVGFGSLGVLGLKWRGVGLGVGRVGLEGALGCAGWAGSLDWVLGGYGCVVLRCVSSLVVAPLLKFKPRWASTSKVWQSQETQAPGPPNPGRSKTFHATVGLSTVTRSPRGLQII